jgi:hypothetical protein
MDIFDTPALNLDMRLSDDNFTIGSTLLRQYQRNGTKLMPSTSMFIYHNLQFLCLILARSTSAQSQQPKIDRPPSLQTYSDDYENITSTGSLTPVKQKLISEKSRPIQQPISEKSRPIQQPISEKSRPIQQPMSEKPRIIQQPVLSKSLISLRELETFLD